MSDEADDMREDYSPLLDGELSPERRAAIEARLAESAEELREFEALRRVDELFRALPRHAAPPAFEASVREAIASQSAPPVLRMRRKTVFPRVGLAAAALLLVVSGVWFFVHAPREDRFMTASTKSRDSSSYQTQSPENHLAGDAGAARMETEKSDENFFFSDRSPAPRAETQADSLAASTAPPTAAFAKTPPASAPPGIAVRADPEPPASQTTTLSAPPASPVAVEAPLSHPSNPEIVSREKTDGTIHDIEAFTIGAQEGKASRGAGGLNAPQTEQTAKRVFVLRENAWVQQEYAQEPAKTVARDSSVVRALMEHDEDLRNLLDLLEAPVIVRVDTTWYHIQAKKSPVPK